MLRCARPFFSDTHCVRTHVIPEMTARIVHGVHCEVYIVQ